ncbi:DNA phosphorothioation-dependent restriction protein DptG [Fundicoccus sp. Sow4_H7]|uniref:DNA phosphorothioation-dependent restriction protein DptG n=1 Tax=Fundicoccus sp. Sow4_H7 TaxID=3438784 RepID=UPI003F8E92C8
MDTVNKLIKLVKLDTGKHYAAQHMRGRLFPFHTRNPERVKFNDPFMDIVGIMVRLTLGFSNDLEDIEEKYIERINTNITTNGDIQQTEVETLFSFNFSEINVPELLKYYPIQHSENEKETNGKIILAKYLNGLFRIDQNQGWKQFISNKHETITLYDQIVSQNLPELSKDRSRREEFQYFNQDEISQLFNEDLNTLMKNESIFMSNIALLVAYYMFYYIVQQAFQIDMSNNKPFEMWYTFENERVSKGRNAYRIGYRLLLDKSKDFLVNVNVVDYLNVLIGHEEVYSLDRLMNEKELSDILLPKIFKFNQQFAQVKKEEFDSFVDLEKQIQQLKRLLKKSLNKEIQSRYAVSFKEFSKLGFIRSRGQLGYILNASPELILLFVSVIVGAQEKMLIRDFFIALEKRGLYFDSMSRREIVAYFEKVNILEKLSDSGDAQYVKSIL